MTLDPRAVALAGDDVQLSRHLREPEAVDDVRGFEGDEGGLRAMDDTVFPIEEFQALVHPLIGLPVALPWKGYGSAIFLELGRLAPLLGSPGAPGDGTPVS